MSEGLTLFKVFTGVWDRIAPRESSFEKEMAKVIAEKIGEGTALAGFTEVELLYLAKAMKPLLKKRERLEGVMWQVKALLPDVAKEMHLLGPAPGATSPDFVNRFRSLAEEVESPEVSDFLARLTAGEISRPGTFSLRALHAVSLLDERTAKALQAVNKMLINGVWFPTFGQLDTFHRGQGTMESVIDLGDAGLIHKDMSVGAEPLEGWEGDGFAGLFTTGRRVIRLAGTKDPLEINLAGYALSNAATELSKLLPEQHDEEFFQLFMRALSIWWDRSAKISWVTAEEFEEEKPPWREFEQ